MNISASKTLQYRMKGYGYKGVTFALSHKSDASWIVSVHGQTAPYRPTKSSTKRLGAYGGHKAGLQALTNHAESFP